MFSMYEGSTKTEFNLQNLFAAPIMYVTGKWLGEKSPNGIYLVRAIWVVGLALASMTLFGVFNSITEHGFTGGVRSLVVSTSGLEISATVLAGLLIILVAYAGVTFSLANEFKNSERVLIFTFFIISLIAATRLGSRTLLALGLLSTLQGIYINRKSYKISRMLLTISALIIFFTVSIEYTSKAIDIFSYYQDRIEDENVGIGSAGGRSEKWMNSLILIVTHPMGWGIEINGYSHNLWLDTARNGGFISLLFLIIITYRVARSIITLISKNSSDITFKTTISCLSVSYLLLFSVEPILDGFVYVFASFCCLWGIIQGYTSK